MEEKEDIQCVRTKHGTFRMDINQFKDAPCTSDIYCVGFFAEHDFDCPKHPTWWERHSIVKKSM
jgi:hypothetical protein